MAKRFIDTGLFDDDWFMELSKDCKLLWLYLITKCDHAGMIKINEKLCRVQTDVKDIAGTIKELGNRIVTVSEHLYFIPKFIEFQYPGFPNSSVRQQHSALEILMKHGLIKDGKLTLTKELPNSYDNDNDNNNDNDNVDGNKHESEEKKPQYDFIQPSFSDSFNLWLEYKRDRREKYKSEKSLKEAYDHLVKLSNNNPDTALLVVRQSMANNWAGLFELKTKDNGRKSITRPTAADFR